MNSAGYSVVYLWYTSMLLNSYLPGRILGHFWWTFEEFVTPQHIFISFLKCFRIYSACSPFKTAWSKNYSRLTRHETVTSHTATQKKLRTKRVFTNYPKVKESRSIGHWSLFGARDCYRVLIDGSEKEEHSANAMTMRLSSLGSYCGSIHFFILNAL